MKKKSVPVSNAVSDNLEEQALFQLGNANYKEAIALYKRLVQETERQEWHEKLAFCYLQRALAFADREMYKEALILWENYSQHTQTPFKAYDHYVIWVIQTKNKSKIQACLEKLTEEQLNKYPMLETLLGLLMLTEYPELQQSLPQESTLVTHFTLVQSALEAYQNNSLEELAERLKQLPYRSAFRDFRILINASLMSKTSIEKMQELLSKIPATSPYRQTAKLMQSCGLEGVELTQGLMSFNHQQQKVVGDVKALNKKQLQFIEQLTRHNGQMTDKIKFNLALKFRSLCYSELPQQFCQTMLITYPAGRREYKKNFSSGSTFEENRFKALSSEAKEDFYEAEHFWMECVKNLLEENTSDNALKVALILRYVAVRLPPSEQTEMLITSLEHDPDDRDCYLKILNNYAQQKDNYKQWLDKILKQFPEDIEVLNLATQSAIQSEAYKKATQSAAKILKLDSLNTTAKQTLFFCHLAHAKGLIKAKKYTLVEKEINQAEGLILDKKYSIKVQLMRGIYCFAAQDKKQGLQLIADALNALNLDSVNMHFQAAIEAQLSGLPVATILRGLPESKAHLLSSPELAVLIKSLKGYVEQGVNQEILHKALAKIKPALKKSVQEQEYDEDQMIEWCQILDSIEHFELLRHYSKLSFSKKWRSPIWAYFRVNSETNGKPENCSFPQILQLKANQGQATKDRDQRAVLLIDKMLDHYYRAHPEKGTEFLEDIFVEEEEGDDIISGLFGHISDEQFRKIDNKISVLFKKLSPEKLAKNMAKSSNTTANKIVKVMMLNPDVLTSLMVVHAAEQLGIDINVNVNDVLNSFAVEEENSAFPFPFPF